MPKPEIFTGTKPDFGYPKQKRLRKKSDYAAVYAQGRRYFTTHFIVYVGLRKDNQLGLLSRTGTAVPKKVGCAVKRNRLKRLLREFFRLHAWLLPKTADIAVVAKKQASHGLDLAQVEVELGSLFAKISQLS